MPWLGCCACGADQSPLCCLRCHRVRLQRRVAPERAACGRGAALTATVSRGSLACAVPSKNPSVSQLE